jgi:hypothetical protein
MKTKLTKLPVQQVIAAIHALDLESVKIRLMDPELGEGWTREYADGIEQGYRTYLTMLAKYQDHAEDILLSRDVDEFWHTHILQTLKYSEDCEAVFGKYLHHNPHVGELTAADVDRRDAMAEKTRRLYQREFGSIENYSVAWSGAPIKTENAAYSNAVIKAENAAYSNAVIKAGNAAYSNAVIKAGNAAYSNAVIKAGNAAYSNAVIKAGNAAYSNAVIEADNAAYSNAVIKADNAAYSNAVIEVENAPYTNAATLVRNAIPSHARIS